MTRLPSRALGVAVKEPAPCADAHARGAGVIMGHNSSLKLCAFLCLVGNPWVWGLSRLSVATAFPLIRPTRSIRAKACQNDILWRYLLQSHYEHNLMMAYLIISCKGGSSKPKFPKP